MRILSILLMAVLLIGCRTSKVSRNESTYLSDSTHVRVDTTSTTATHTEQREDKQTETNNDKVVGHIVETQVGDTTKRLIYFEWNFNRKFGKTSIVDIADATATESKSEAMESQSELEHSEVKEVRKKPPLSEKARTLICLAIAIGGGLLGFKAWIGYVKAEGMK